MVQTIGAQPLSVYGSPATASTEVLRQKVDGAAAKLLKVPWLLFVDGKAFLPLACGLWLVAVWPSESGW